jgi:hypothetical protein
MKFQILFLSFVGFLFTGCTSDQTSDEVSDMVFGIYAPRCVGNCTNLFKVEDGKLFAQVGENRFLTDVIFDKKAMPQEKYVLAESVLQSIPIAIYSSGNPVGCPGCVDEPYLYFEFFTVEGNRSVNVDMQMSDLPKDLQPWVTSCVKMIEELK